MDNPLSIIAHQLRTPLTVITSTVNNLLDGAFGPLKDDQRRWLKKLESHTSHLEQLLSQILELMKSNPSQAEVVNQSLAEPVGSATLSHSSASKPSDSASKIKETPNAPTVLVVDDEDDIRDVVQEALSMKGYHVLSAPNGTEGMKMVQEKCPDVILMDVMLGNENGLEVGHAMKEKLKKFVPMILMTGQDDLREKISGSSLQPDEILAKPFQMAELYARVGSMLRLKKLSDQLEQAG